MYYQKHKERLQKEASERYQNLSAEEKDKSRKKARERYHNLTKKKKNKGAIVMKNVSKSYLIMEVIII